jgi:DNA topoisomerase-1
MAKIHYRNEEDRTWRRTKKGGGFHYHDVKNNSLSKEGVERIEHLVIPPAWTDVVISPDPTDYIQALGTDADGRRQYIYHPDWVAQNQEHKFDQMVMFGERLPTLREVVKGHMRQRELTHDRVVATVVWLLEHTFIRVGNKTYAQDHQSYGLTTLREKHVELEGNHIAFSFKGKSGVYHELGITHPRVAQTLRECIELPGYELFQYLTDTGTRRVVDSADVNAYLQEHIGDDFSAKHFRTWGGSVLAGDSLYQKGEPENEKEREKNIIETVTEVSEHLGNTRTVCRTYYIHPAIITEYEKSTLVPHFQNSYSHAAQRKNELSPEEYATWSLIKNH